MLRKRLVIWESELVAQQSLKIIVLFLKFNSYQLISRGSLLL